MTKLDAYSIGARRSAAADGIKEILPLVRHVPYKFGVEADAWSAQLNAAKEVQSRLSALAVRPDSGRPPSDVHPDVPSRNGVGRSIGQIVVLSLLPLRIGAESFVKISTHQLPLLGLQFGPLRGRSAASGFSLLYDEMFLMRYDSRADMPPSTTDTARSRGLPKNASGSDVCRAGTERALHEVGEHPLVAVA